MITFQMVPVSTCVVGVAALAAAPERTEYSFAMPRLLLEPTSRKRADVANQQTNDLQQAAVNVCEGSFPG